jgi:HPt (histidine-containing phosphotransfer) domain-containing protein
MYTQSASPSRIRKTMLAPSNRKLQQHAPLGAKLAFERQSMSLIKIEALAQFIQGDEELLADLSTLFVQYYPDIAARLNLAIDNGDGESLRETAHQLKSRLGYFQAPVLVDCACRLETCGKTGDLDEADAILKSLFDGIRQLVSELRELTHLSLSLNEND